jgi:hypothetical protein
MPRYFILICYTFLVHLNHKRTKERKNNGRKREKERILSWFYLFSSWPEVNGSLTQVSLSKCVFLCCDRNRNKKQKKRGSVWRTSWVETRSLTSLAQPSLRPTSKWKEGTRRNGLHLYEQILSCPAKYFMESFWNPTFYWHPSLSDFRVMEAGKWKRMHSVSIDIHNKQLCTQEWSKC